MRYIDAEKLTEEMWQEIRSFSSNGEIYDGADALLTVKNQPTADVRENVKAYWKNVNDEYYSCSYCGGCSDIAYHYCPWCGADMRGANDD